MRIFLTCSVIFLSCAASQAGADVLITNGNTPVVVGGRYADDDIADRNNPVEYYDSNGGRLDIYNGRGSRDGEAFIVRDGQLTPLGDGSYRLPSGENINIKNGRAQARFGNDDDDSIRDNIKILPRN